MPIPALTAMGFTGIEDSQYFTDSPVDGSMSYEMTGGIYITRKRFTRTPGRMMVTGFSNLSTQNKQKLDAFYNSMGGNAQQFYYTHPATLEPLVVRFFGTVYAAAFKGIGAHQVWEVTGINLKAS